MSAVPVVRRMVTLAALAAAGLLAGALARARFGGVKLAGTADIGTATAAAPGMAVGPENGTVELRIFGDYECPACRGLERAAGDSLRALARNGRIRFVYHHAPLRGHRRGPRAAAVAYCAHDAGVTWPVHRALYESAPAWGSGPDGDRHLIDVAAAAADRESAVADTAWLRECASGDRGTGRVAADRAAADALGIHSVPAIFLGDQRLRVASWSALVRFVTAQARSP